MISADGLASFDSSSSGHCLIRRFGRRTERRHNKIVNTMSLKLVHQLAPDQQSQCMQGNCNSPDWWLLKSAGVAGRKYDQALCATGNRYGDRRLSAVMRARYDYLTSVRRKGSAISSWPLRLLKNISAISPQPTNREKNVPRPRAIQPCFPISTPVVAPHVIRAPAPVSNNMAVRMVNRAISAPLVFLISCSRCSEVCVGLQV